MASASHRLRNNQYAIEITENQIARIHANFAYVNRATIIHHRRSNTRILRITAAAEDGPVLLQHLRRIAMEAVDHGADTTPHSRGRRHDLSPARAGKRFRCDIHFACFDLIERARELAETSRAADR